MKRTYLILGGAAVSGLLLAAGVALEPAAAQQTTQQATPMFLFLDVQKVFSDYKKFQFLTEELKTQLDAKEKQLVEFEQQIKAQADQLPLMTNQADRDEVQKKITELKFEYEKTRRDARQEFLAKEADIYASVYDEVHKIVKGYCEQNRFLAVFRVQDAETKDRSAPNRILQVLNREVVYHDPRYDLTKVITDGLNKTYEGAQAQRPNAPTVR